MAIAELVAALMAPGDLPDWPSIDAYRPEWQRDALCAEHHEVDFFPARLDRRAFDAAKEICYRCAVRSECLDYAVGDPTLDGVWGATSKWERRIMRHDRQAREPRPVGGGRVDFGL